MNNKQIKFLLALSLALMAIFAVLAAGLSESGDASDTTDLQALIKDGATVVLEKDYDIEDSIRIPTGVTVILDLNGHTITSTSGVLDETKDPKDLGMIEVRGGTLIIRDSQWTFSASASTGIIAKDKDSYGINIRSGICQVESGSVTGSCEAIQVITGTLEITGGQFQIKKDENIYEYKYIINCIDAKYTSEEAVVKIAGGYFYKFDPANNLAEGSGTNFAVSGYTWTSDGNYYRCDEKAVAKVINGTTKTYYKTIDDAILAATLGNTIVFVDDASSSTTLPSIYGDLSLNGYTFTTTGYDRKFYGYNICNGEIIGNDNKNLRVLSDQKDVTFTKVSFKYANVFTGGGAKSITFTGCDFYAYKTDPQTEKGELGIYVNGGNVQLNVVGCTFNGNY